MNKSRRHEIEEELKNSDVTTSWKERALLYKELANSDKESGISSLDHQWALIKDDVPYLEDSLEEALYSTSALKALYDCVTWESNYPPPELLKVVADQIGMYLKSEGEITLEEAAFGTVGSAGIYSKRDVRHSKKKRMFVHFSINIVKHQRLKTNKTQAQILEELIEKDSSITLQSGSIALQCPIYEWASSLSGEQADNAVETFLKGYRRWRKTKGAYWVGYNPKTD